MSGRKKSRLHRYIHNAIYLMNVEDREKEESGLHIEINKFRGLL